MGLGPKKIFLLIRWSKGTHRSLVSKASVNKVYRPLIMSVGNLVRSRVRVKIRARVKIFSA